MIVELFAALTAAAAITMLGLLVVRTNADPASARLKNLNDPPPPPAMEAALSSSKIMKRGPSSIPFLRRTLERSPRASRWEREIAQAGLKLRVSEYFLGRVVLALMLFLATVLVGKSSVALIVGLVLAWAGFMLPAFWLAHQRSARIAGIAKQLPEAVTLMANAMKAGFAFQHGIAMVAEEMGPPLADEFARVMVDLNVGASVEEALYAMLDRADSEDLHLMVTAIMIQRQSGGNLAEILEMVGDTMRERERLTGEVKTMTSQQRFSGTVLTLWPSAILGIFAIFNWHQTKLLFTTNIGLIMLSLAIAGQVFGYLTIRKILDVDI